MSTRRARIKAVAALPVRRRNNETGEKKSNNENVMVSPVKESKNAQPTETKLDNPIEIDPNTLKDDKKPVATNTACEIIIEFESERSSNDIDYNTGNCEVAWSEGPEDIVNETIESVLGTEHIYIVQEKFEELSEDTLIKVPENSEALTLVDINVNQQITSTDQIINKDANSNNSEMVLAIQEIELVTEPLITDVDFNPPSIPESITEETIMDGIVPLQTAPHTPRPVQVLKNQIISENAEVLFDPIVPLPSPSKIRPKLRPTPRLNPVRRNSIQGSASESEDENRRTLLSSGAQTLTPARQRHDSHTSHSTMHSVPNRDVKRTRNDSVCSSVSHIAPQTPHAVSPLKEKTSTNTRRRDTGRKLAAMCRRREAVKPETLTMYDLIYYNPKNNPIVPDEDEVAAIAANKRDEAERCTVTKAPPGEPEEPEAEAVPAPRVKLGPNGEIVLDEKSLVIKQTQAMRVLHSGAVREGAWSAGGGRYTRGPRTAEWSALETVRFYRALAALGTDFSLMTPLFPGRSRRDLKIKFKREEKLNMAQVDLALRSATSFNVTEMQTRFEEEREAEARSQREQRESLERRRCEDRARAEHRRSMRLKGSKGSKAMETTTMVVSKANDRLAAAEATTADAVLRRTEHRRFMRLKGSKGSKAMETTTMVVSKANDQLAAAEATTADAVLRRLEQRARARQAQTIAKKKPSATETPPNENAARHDTPQPPLSIAATPQPPLSIATTPQPSAGNATPLAVPTNIETGSLVVLTVNDPSSPSKKMLQTYISEGAGKLTPVALSSTFLNSVVGYMKKTPKGGAPAGSSPQLASPAGVAEPEGCDGRTSATPNLKTISLSPMKRPRLGSYTIMQL